MNYTEVIINCPMDGVDELSAELMGMGIDGLITENEEQFREFLENNRDCWDYVDDSLSQSYSGLSRIKFYLNDDEPGHALLKKVKNRWPECELSSCSDSDWENNWKEYYKPIEIGSRLVVVPQWEELPDDGRTPLILDPGLIFGTGSHATTKTCLAVLDGLDLSGKRVLDLGCGSGILGIGALVLGAESVAAVDIDEKAPKVVMENAALNGISPSQLQAYAGDVIHDNALMKSLGSGYDLVLANIVADVIIALAPNVRPFMAPGALFICSGIIDGRDDEVISALKAAGFEIAEHRRLEEWNTFVCR